MQFGLLKAEEVARMSVVRVDNVRIYNDRGAPNFNAINDPRMGTMEKEMKCYTCKGSKYPILMPHK
jgi:DNA-directed RNA polymerase II subunit RPB1